MLLDYKIYQDKILFAETLKNHHAVAVAKSLPRAIIKKAGRVVWNTAKDGSINDDAYSYVTLQERIQKHEREARAKYEKQYGVEL